MMRAIRQLIWTSTLLMMAWALGYAQDLSSQAEQKAAASVAPAEFEIIEGIFHDGLGTFAELKLANKLIELARINQPPFDLARSEAKMRAAVERLPAKHPARARFAQEQANVVTGVERGAALLIERAQPARLAHVRHTAKEFADAKAADIVLEFDDHTRLPVSVKTEKSNKVAVAEGQTPELQAKWAERYFQVSAPEFAALVRELGFASMAELKAHYLNVAQLVAHILMRRLALVDCEPDDFSRARVSNLEAVKFLLRQLLKFKHGSDGSVVIIFDRTRGTVAWETRLEAIDIERLTAERISFRPSRPRAGQPIASEFGIKIDGQVVVTFQIKHRRGKARGGTRQFEFSDITTRLMI